MIHGSPQPNTTVAEQGKREREKRASYRGIMDAEGLDSDGGDGAIGKVGVLPVAAVL